MSFLTNELGSIALPFKILVLLGVALGTHLTVILLRRGATFLIQRETGRAYIKVKTVVSLATSTLVFTLYFLAIGLILREFNVSLTAYLASASVIGLAIGFGSQGVVQDFVTGLTFIFSGLFELGEMVEISGQSGIVKSIGMRFVGLENSCGAQIFIPNRTITSVITYPRGYVRCITDIALVSEEKVATQMQETITAAVADFNEQFPGVLRTEPSVEGRIRTRGGQQFLRIKFRIWPGRGDPIEGTFKPKLLAAMKALDPGYADWQISVYYEIERQVRLRR